MHPTTRGELLRFIGVTILATRYEFGSRAELWSNKPRNPYLIAPAFDERTGLSRCRFDSLWSCVVFSEQKSGGRDDSEQSRWEFITDFIDSINAHRDAHMSPSEYICVDESMCKWYAQGGPWIKRGLPMYVAIDRKPENGCEIQNAACGRSGIMLRLSVVTSAENQRAVGTNADGGVPHGAAVMKRLVAPWAGTQRVVCADSNFASVTAATELLAMGLRFIGVVKTATRGYPMSSLSALEVDTRGDHATFSHSTPEGTMKLMALMWVDRERRYFVSSTSTSLPGNPHDRVRWLQMGEDAERVALKFKLPQVAQAYLECCAQIDRHNRCRQNDLQLEHKLPTHVWSMRVSVSLSGMCVVDSWLLYSGARGETAALTQRQFYEDLAAHLIDNTFDTVGVRARATPSSAPVEEVGAPLRYGVGIHVTPRGKRRSGASVGAGDHRDQCNCRVCKRHKSSQVCSGCRGGVDGEMFLCGPKTGRSCFEAHLRTVHELDV